MPEKRLLGINPKAHSYIYRSRKKKLLNTQVLKMLSVMDASQGARATSSATNAPPTPDSSTNAEEFLSSGRTGRRNALPDILSQHAVVTSSDLPAKLQALTTSDQVSDSQHQSSTYPGKS